MLQAMELSKLRTKLRSVNVEYSALVRDKHREGRFARMGELSSERRALMALISAATEKGRWGIPYRRQAIDTVSHDVGRAMPDL